jgi:hypothetical protein
MDAFCLYLRTQEGYHATTAKNKSQRKDRWIDDGPYLPDDFKKKIRWKPWGQICSTFFAGANTLPNCVTEYTDLSHVLDWEVQMLSLKPKS